MTSAGASPSRVLRGCDIRRFSRSSRSTPWIEEGLFPLVLPARGRLQTAYRPRIPFAGCVIAIAILCAGLTHAADPDASATSEEWGRAVASPSISGATTAGVPAAPATPSAAPSTAAGPPLAVAGYSRPPEIAAPSSRASSARAPEISANGEPSNLRADTDEPAEQKATPPTTQEIPTAQNQPPPPQPPPQTRDADDPPEVDQGDLAEYEHDQVGLDPNQIGNLHGYLPLAEMSTPLGLELRESRRKLNTGEEADGLLIVKVDKGSPAANAGLHAYRRTVHTALTGVALAAAMFFPPAIFVVPMLDYAHVGESYDLIIGVDGSRVANFNQFQDKMRDVQPGEILYLSVVRNGKRQQIKVFLPLAATATAK